MPIKSDNHLKLVEYEPHPLSPSPKKERGNAICGVFTLSRSPLLLGEGDRGEVQLLIRIKII